MYKFEKARTFAVVMAILNFVVAKVFCYLTAGLRGIPAPITYIFVGRLVPYFSYGEYWYNITNDDVFAIAAMVFLVLAILFALIAYICHQLSEAEYKWK